MSWVPPKIMQNGLAGVEATLNGPSRNSADRLSGSCADSSWIRPRIGERQLRLGCHLPIRNQFHGTFDGGRRTLDEKHPC